MTKKKEQKTEKSIPVGVSPKAHKIMKQALIDSKTSSNLREHINILNNLPAEA